MPRYRIIETCQATVETTYTVEADDPEAARALVEAGDVEEDEEEVYGHQSAEYEIEELPRRDAP
jgi:hypothetical protein